MIYKIRTLIVKYWDILIYLVFGVLTTVVNYLETYHQCSGGGSELRCQ